MSHATIEERKTRPIRAGVFANVAGASAAVNQLLSAGFAKDEITVICSDEAKEQHFREFEHQKPAGTNTPVAMALGSSIAAGLGGITIAAGLAAGGLPLVIVGGAALMTGGVVGGFLGAMLTRGGEKEASNYYDQAVLAGKLLVAVECHSADAEQRLARAERILDEAGAESEPLPLAEG
jgi:hypothetical protein